MTPTFLDEKDGNYRVIAFFAKRARGAMAGWMIRERVKTRKALAEFDGLGYRYDPRALHVGHPRLRSSRGCIGRRLSAV